MISAICSRFSSYCNLNFMHWKSLSGVNKSNVALVSTFYYTKKDKKRRDLLRTGRKRDPGLIFVVLKKGIEGLGKKYQVVQVRRGFATNYLIPTKSALYATRENLFKCGITTSARKAALASLDLTKKGASPMDKLLKYLARETLNIEVSRDEGWCISKYTVAQEYQRKLQLYVPLQSLIIKTPLQTLGLHKIKIKVNDEVGLVATNINITKHIPKKSETSSES